VAGFDAVVSNSRLSRVAIQGEINDDELIRESAFTWTTRETQPRGWHLAIFGNDIPDQ